MLKVANLKFKVLNNTIALHFVKIWNCDLALVTISAAFKIFTESWVIS